MSSQPLFHAQLNGKVSSQGHWRDYRLEISQTDTAEVRGEPVFIGALSVFDPEGKRLGQIDFRAAETIVTVGELPPIIWSLPNHRHMLLRTEDMLKTQAALYDLSALVAEASFNHYSSLSLETSLRMEASSCLQTGQGIGLVSRHDLSRGQHTLS